MPHLAYLPFKVTLTKGVLTFSLLVFSVVFNSRIFFLVGWWQPTGYLRVFSINHGKIYKVCMVLSTFRVGVCLFSAGLTELWSSVCWST